MIPLNQYARAAGTIPNGRKKIPMNLTSNKVSAEKPHSIGYLFDTYDPRQNECFHVLQRSFGERFAVAEVVEPPRYLYLELRPGGLLDVRR